MCFYKVVQETHFLNHLENRLRYYEELSFFFFFFNAPVPQDIPYEFKGVTSGL